MCVSATLFVAALIVAADTSAVKLPVRLVAPTPPVSLPYGDELPKLLVLVSNPTPVARQVVVEAFVFSEDKTLLSKYVLSENVRAGDDALIKEVMEPCHRGFVEVICTVAAIQVRASAGKLVTQPKAMPAWLQLSFSDFATSIEEFGKRQAQASVVVTNRNPRDAHIYLRFRLYNRDGFQVAVCTNEPRPIFSDKNLLVPSGSSTRLACAVDAFQDVADVPSSVRVELLGWELRR